jgi:hypothetical protein
VSIVEYIPENEFYESIDKQLFQPGQLCWLPVPHIDPIPRILAVERSSPEEHEELKFRLREANQKGDFKAPDRTLPLKHVPLRSNEELLVQKAKRRRGVILARGMDIYEDITPILRQKAKKHLQEDALFLIPLYGIQQEEYGAGFPPEMVARIKCLLYRQFFYFPSHGVLREAVARFDRIQVVVSRDPAAIDPIDFCLSGMSFAVFLAMFIYCMTGQEDEDLGTLRELCREAYPQDLS